MSASLPDPLNTLRAKLEQELHQALGRRGTYAGVKDGIAADDCLSAAYNDGLIAGLAVAAGLVAREQARQQAIRDEHVPGRVYS
jgi:hypothetical protein